MFPYDPAPTSPMVAGVDYILVDEYSTRSHMTDETIDAAVKERFPTATKTFPRRVRVKLTILGWLHPLVHIGVKNFEMVDGRMIELPETCYFCGVRRD